jgi:hypothetical protein
VQVVCKWEDGFTGHRYSFDHLTSVENYFDRLIQTHFRIDRFTYDVAGRQVRMGLKSRDKAADVGQYSIALHHNEFECCP